MSRDFNSNYMRALEVMGDDERFMDADDNGDIFTLQRQADAAIDEMRSKMEPRGIFHLGDSINVFCRGSLNSQPAEQEGTGALVAALSSSSKATTSPTKAANGLSAVAGPGSVSILSGTVSGAIGTKGVNNHHPRSRVLHILQRP